MNWFHINLPLPYPAIRGRLAYPCPLLVNGRLVFSYDRNRREARFVEVEFQSP